MTVNFAKWLSFGAWTAEEGACLLCGIDPQMHKSMEASRRMTSMSALHELLLFGHSTSPRDEKYLKENEILNSIKYIKEALERDTRGHIINESSIDDEGRYYYPPIDIIRWAFSKDFIHVPDELGAFVTNYRPQFKSNGVNEIDSHENAELLSTKAIQANRNDIRFSGLLNIPGKADDWFQVIDDMTKAFHNKHHKLPNETQAWSQLWTKPPIGYEITQGKDKGEDCLRMSGAKSLSRSAFSKRWGKYTADKAQ